MSDQEKDKVVGSTEKAFAEAVVANLEQKESNSKIQPLTIAAKTKKRPATKDKPVKIEVKNSKAKETSTGRASAQKQKGIIMATANKTTSSDVIGKAKEVFSEVKDRAKTAYKKTEAFASDVKDFNKDNADAFLQSGKIFFSGMQEIGQEHISATKTAAETVEEDLKRVAAVKSPTELLKLQGELTSRNFEAALSLGAKNTEAMVKLYTDAFAPVSSRVSVVAEKIKNAA